MPGFATHYLFGTKTRLMLADTSLKKNLNTHPFAFHLGLQGPDVFFYYLPAYILHRQNIGSVAHTDNTQQFFRNLLVYSRKLFSKNELTIAQAYIGGCFAHYVLDTTCHPFIYYRTHYNGRQKDYFGRHVQLETELDTLFLSREKSLSNGAFISENTIRLSKQELHVISLLLYKTYQKTYPQVLVTQGMMKRCIYSLQWGCKFLRDPSRKKKIRIQKLEQFFLGYPVLSTLIANPTLAFHKDPLNLAHDLWKNPWDASYESHESFEDLIDSARVNLLAIWDLAEELWKNPAHLDRPIYLKLLKTLGNNSYHSGLHCSIPS